MEENKEYKIPAEVEELAEDLSDGWFNFRFIEKEYKYGEDIIEKYYEIHEVYYKADGSIWAWSAEPISPMFEDFDDVKETIRHIFECCKKTVLKFTDESKETVVDTGEYIEGYSSSFFR